MKYLTYSSAGLELVPKFIEPPQRESYTKKVIYAKRNGGPGRQHGCLAACFLTGGLQIYTNSSPAHMSE